MDVRYINPFIGAMRHLFKTKLDTDIVISKPALKEEDESSPDISAMIGFSGGAVGSVTLCFPKRSALRIAGKFVGAEILLNDPDLVAALCELANLLAGQAEASMKGLNVTISQPSVTARNDNRIPNSNKTPVLAMPCDSSLGRFWIEVTMTGEEQRSTTKQPVSAAGHA